MPKLTFYKPDGTWGIEGVKWSSVPRRLYGALHKLMAMEHSFERHIDPPGTCACQFCERRYDDLGSYPCSVCPAIPKGRM